MWWNIYHLLYSNKHNAACDVTKKWQIATSFGISNAGYLRKNIIYRDKNKSSKIRLMVYEPKHKRTPLKSYSLRITPLPLWAMAYTDTS